VTTFRALVTGANSPLGLAVGRRLRAEGSRATGTIRAATSGGLHEIFDELIALDLTSPASIKAISGNFDAVIHVAALSEGSISEIMNVTGIASGLLVQRAVELGVPRFVHVSSMSVYGEVTERWVTSSTPVRHTTPYGVAKWFAESALALQRETISGVSVRSPAIVGARSHRHFLANLLMAMIRQSPEVRVSNPEFLSNNLIHEDTLADFLIELAKSTSSGYVAFPVASCESLPLSEVVSRMAAATAYRGEIVWVPSSSKPFSIDLEAALAHGLCPLTMDETMKKWLANVVRRPREGSL